MKTCLCLPRIMTVAEQDRVWRAIQTVVKTKTDDMWWRLVRHTGDTRYALTGNCNEFVDLDAENYSVSSLCSHIAARRISVFLTHGT